MKRKPILIIDDSMKSKKIVNVFKESNVDFVTYNIKKFEESCCGDLPTTKAPSVIAAEGIFKEEEDIVDYVKHLKEKQNQERHFTKDIKIESIKIEESESAYW